VAANCAKLHNQQMPRMQRHDKSPNKWGQGLF